MGNYRLRTMSINISGEQEQLRLLRAAASGMNEDGDKVVAFSLQSLFPSPLDELIGKTECYCKTKVGDVNVIRLGYRNFYKWRLARWGSMTDVDWCNELIVKDDEWKIYFQIWDSYPIDAIIKISLNYPMLNFKITKFIEDSLDHGICSIEDGKYIDGGWWPDDEGYFEDGFNFKGFNREGVFQDGTVYGDDGYDVNGFGRDGYNPAGFNKEGIHRETQTKYDLDGFNLRECDRYGYHIKEHEGFRRGFDEQGINRLTQTLYDMDGYDQNGNDINGKDEVPF